MTVRLLIVEDTPHVRDMLVDILELHGFEIVGEAATGDQALDLSQKADPDVVVVDFKMPGMDGLELARLIREARPEQQVILYSAFIDGALQRRAQEIGVAMCVPKLAGIEELAREITAVAMDLERG